jgi:hypothetical protein
VHKVGDQPRLYYDARSASHQHVFYCLKKIFHGINGDMYVFSPNKRDAEVMYKNKFNVLQPTGKFPTMHLRV